MTEPQADEARRVLPVADLSVRTSTGLTARVTLPASPRAVAVLLHGIPSVAPPDPRDEGYAGFARDLAARGIGAVWGDMRGARDAPGYFSIEGWVADASALVDKARELAPGAPVVAVGSSAGGAVALEVAARGAPVDAVACLAAPAEWGAFAAGSADGIARITEDAGMPVAPEAHVSPEQWAGEFDRVTAERSIARVDVPVVIVHGTDDDVVPVEHARRLAAAHPGAELEVLPGAPHTLRRDPRVLPLLLGWIDRAIG